MKTMDQTAQKLALPPFLRKGLEAVRVGSNKDQKYLIRCKVKGKTYKFDPWQFFILEVLPVYDTYSELAPIFEERFGHLISESEVKEFIELVFELGLFGELAFTHPMLDPYKNVNKTLMVGKVPHKESYGRKNMQINDPGETGTVELQPTKNPVRQTDLYLDAEADPLVTDNVTSPTPGAIKENPAVDMIKVESGKGHQHLLRAMQKAKLSSLTDSGRPSENRTATPEPPHTDQNPGFYHNTNVAPSILEVTPSPSIGKKLNQETTIDGSAATSGQKPSAGFQDSDGPDESGGHKGFKLFNPSWMIKILYPLFSPLRYTIYLLPLLFIAALFLMFHRIYLFAADFQVWFSTVSFFKHVLLGMVTVNLSVTLVTALVAYSFRATVNAFCIVFYLLFLPRFMVRIENMQQLQRRERIWLYAVPLLLRVGFFSIGILLWFNSRTEFEILAGFALAIAFIGALSFIITVNPLIKSSGYNLLAAYINEPYLREKSYKALLGKFKGNVYKAADNNILVAYALVSILYTLIVAVALIYIFGTYLQIELGATSLLLIGLIAIVLLMRTIKNFIKLKEAYERQVQFERWRKRVIPEKEDDQTAKKEPSTVFKYLRRSALLIVIVLLFVPYTYEPGGNFIVLPNEQQTITTEIGGIIESINYDGGEFLKKATVIGKLSYSDYEAQVKIYDAKISQQQAVIDDLKSRPRPEEVKMAQTALETQRTQAAFSRDKASRLQNLYKEGVVSLEDLEDARRTYEVDLDQVQEKRANLELVKRGATPEELAEAEAKLQSYIEERNRNQEKIEQSVFHMPFDGKLISLHLKRKVGSFLNRGEPLAVAEQAEKVKLEIEVPESDISYIKDGSEVRCRFHVYHDQDFLGVVKTIDANVTKENYGKVIKIVTLLENKDEKIKSGMTGFAKISGEEMPLWKVLSMAFIRFIKVEVWSWMP